MKVPIRIRLTVGYERGCATPVDLHLECDTSLECVLITLQRGDSTKQHVALEVSEAEQVIVTLRAVLDDLEALKKAVDFY